MKLFTTILHFIVSCVLAISTFSTTLPLKVGGYQNHTSPAQLIKSCESEITKKLLDETITISNEAEADLIVITGDFVQFAPEPSEHLAQDYLSQLHARYGVYGVLGNHDLKESHSKSFITQQLKKANVKILDNEVHFPMGTDQGALMLVGFCDYTRKQFKIEPVEHHLLDLDRPKLILSHNPDSAEVLRKYRADVILAGHTHGGQVLIPLLGTPLPLLKRILPRSILKYLPLPVDVIRNWDWIEGLHVVPRENSSGSGSSGSSERNGGGGTSGSGAREIENEGVNYLYTNRGLATHPPLRLNCSPEITIIHLVPSSPS